MAQLKNDLVPFITKDEIAKIIKQLARQIESDYDGKEIIFVCPLRGSIATNAACTRVLSSQSVCIR